MGEKGSSLDIHICYVLYHLICLPVGIGIFTFYNFFVYALFMLIAVADDICICRLWVLLKQIISFLIVANVLWRSFSAAHAIVLSLIIQTSVDRFNFSSGSSKNNASIIILWPITGSIPIPNNYVHSYWYNDGVFYNINWIYNTMHLIFLN